MSTYLKSILILLVFAGCAGKKERPTYPTLPNYDLTNPIMIYLRTELDEISGIFYYPKDSSLFAINDELGVLYKIFIRKDVKIKKWKFSGFGDYEDIVLVDSTFYALRSDGNLKIFRFVTIDSLANEDCQLPIMGENDFETLYYDDEKDKLVLMCKTCEDEDPNTVAAFSFNPSDETFKNGEAYKLNVSGVNRQLGKDVRKFRPSAAAIHPITKDLYIISSLAKSIVIADRDGKIKAAYQIDPALFKQPEGITFTPEGDLIICNEASGIGAANILVFKYKPAVNEKG